MTYRPDDQGDVSIGQAEIDVQEMLHRELYGLPHQKVVFASVVDVQEARKARMLALIDGLDPRLNRRLIHLQALDPVEQTVSRDPLWIRWWNRPISYVGVCFPA